MPLNGTTSYLPHRPQRIARLDLEDLHDNEASTGILLDMQDRQRYFDGRANSATDGAAAGPVSTHYI